MQSLSRTINFVCTEYPLKEKIVIIDSFLVGEQINDSYINNGYHAVNLKYKTVFELAKELVELNSEHSMKLLDHTLGVHFTYTLLNQLKEEKSLNYFAGMEITPSFSHAMYNTIKTLRLAGYSSASLPIEYFLTPSKGEDLREILSSYEKLLAFGKWLDEAALLIEAKEHAVQRQESVFILQSNLHLTYLEEEFLQSLLSEVLFKLPLAPVYGLQIPEQSSLRSIAWSEPEPLSYIYDLEHAKSTPNLSVFSAKTEEIEVKHILEQIKNSNTKLDENIIFYTSEEPYVTLFYHLTQKGDVPITFGEGLPVSFSRPGKFISGLIEWIQTNYSVEAFLELLHEGLFELGKGAPSNTQITTYLRDLQVGWSEERYFRQITKETTRLETILSAKDNKDDYQERKLNHLSWLSKWFSQIFKKLPDYGNQMNYQQCLLGISYLLKNHCKTNSALDETAKTALLEKIDNVIPYGDETLPSFDVFEKVRDLLLTERVSQSRPKPGHLHVSSYKSGVYNNRANVFFVGLDNQRFPGGSSEDPMLLDAERIELGRNLPLIQESGTLNLYTLLQVLAHSTGKVSMSYCNFNINDNRTLSPAHVFLQCYRLASGNKYAEFKALKKLPSPLVSTDIFEDKDYWNEQLLDEQEKELDETLLQYFQNIAYGLESERSRSAGEFTFYDGLVEIDGSVMDPRMNKEITVTAGKLETLAKCPYSYFLQEVLRVRPIEETAYDPYRWLDPATRGSLLHSIFEMFYKELQKEKATPSFALHEEKILSIANSLIEEQKESFPPPNERVYAREVNDIVECSRIFLKEEEHHCDDYEPLHFEYSFGIGDIAPAEITLPSGETVNVSGKIDRVDKASSGAFHIIDYKTGSTYGYRMNEIFKGGRQLQHLIYALAIEQHLQLETGAVQESAYYFPTVKGLAQRFVRSQDENVRTNGTDILEKLIDIIKSGTFTMTDDVNDCTFCDFKNVCRRSFYEQDILEAKQMDKEHEQLKGFKGVRAYE